MKKLILTVLASTLLILGHSAVGDTQEVPAQQAPASDERQFPAAVIDDIAVPFDVTIYVQKKYPGHAIIQASKTFWRGQQVYRLRIDHDSHDYESHYLYYDKDWELLDDQRLLYTPPPVVREPEEDDEEKPEDRQPEDEPIADPALPPDINDDGEDEDDPGDDEDRREFHERIRRRWREDR